MNKTIISSIFVLLSSSVFAEASIDINDKDKTYLLTAPGTVTGTDKKNKPTENPAISSLPRQRPAQRQRYQRYKYVGENKRFRQFGQQPGQNNPWFEDYNQGYPRHPAPYAGQSITNPWQLGGMPPLRGADSRHRQAPYSNSPYSPYGAEQYSADNFLYPDFPDGIFRDSNPAARPLPGLNGGLMRGFGGNNLGFPFSPFGMF